MGRLDVAMEVPDKHILHQRNEAIATNLHQIPSVQISEICLYTKQGILRM